MKIQTKPKSSSYTILLVLCQIVKWFVKFSSRFHLESAITFFLDHLKKIRPMRHPAGARGAGASRRRREEAFRPRAGGGTLGCRRARLSAKRARAGERGEQVAGRGRQKIKRAVPCPL